MCRLGAVKISILRPTLDAANVKLVAVGLEQLGVEEFVELRYFDGGKPSLPVCITSVLIGQLDGDALSVSSHSSRGVH